MTERKRSSLKEWPLKPDGTRGSSEPPAKVTAKAQAAADAAAAREGEDTDEGKAAESAES